MANQLALQSKPTTNQITNMSKSREETVKILLDQGWLEFPDLFRKSDRCLYKRFDTPTMCRCNDDKKVIQVGIAVYEHLGKCSYELQLCGEIHDGTWVDLKNYSLPDEINEGLLLIPRLLNTWESIASQPTK